MCKISIAHFYFEMFSLVLVLICTKETFPYYGSVIPIMKMGNATRTDFPTNNIYYHMGPRAIKIRLPELSSDKGNLENFENASEFNP